jgi:hypothetical protein
VLRTDKCECRTQEKTCQASFLIVLHFSLAEFTFRTQRIEAYHYIGHAALQRTLSRVQRYYPCPTLNTMPSAPQQRRKAPSKKITFRVHSDELQRIKSSSSAQRINPSELIRSILFSSPILCQSSADANPEKKELETTELAGRASQSENLTNKRRGRLCVHGFRVLARSTQCATCSNLGIQYKYQYD